MNPSRRHCLGALALSPGLALAGSRAITSPSRVRRAPAARGLYTLDTAPDYASRLALAQPVRRLTDGASPGSDHFAAIHRNFARVIEQNFACASASRVTRWLDTVEPRSLVALAQAYVNASEMKGRNLAALEILAHRLDAARLARIATYFGHARVHSAVLKAAPGKLEAFNARANVNHRGPVPGEMNLHPDEAHLGASQGRGYLIFLDYTLEEIFLSFRTAPVGATSVAASMFQTGLVVGAGVTAGWMTGQAIGGYLVQGMRAFAPNVWDSLVDAVGRWVEELTRPPLLPPDSYRSPEEQMGDHQRDGFLEVFNLDEDIYDDFAIDAGDYESAWEWANWLPPEPYPGLPICGPLEDNCGEIHPNRSRAAPGLRRSR